MSFFSLNTSAIANQESEHYKIVYLLNVIGTSDLVFIRNGVEYTGEEAKAHLQEKLDFVGDHIRTAEDFINYIASESSVTGVSYYVRLADGKQMEAGIWLRGELAKMK
ncbi:MAG: DUF5329 family protein [Alphaproteobacteria bacterium]|nr:DUF5329 family protein [Alphaproteobacteria bacterium]